jgi:hypothetical protein
LVDAPFFSNRCRLSVVPGHEARQLLDWQFDFNFECNRSQETFHHRWSKCQATRPALGATSNRGQGP